VRRCTVAGIDLAGSPERNSSTGRMSGRRVLACLTLHEDKEILDLSKEARAELVVIDGPNRLETWNVEQFFSPIARNDAV